MKVTKAFYIGLFVGAMIYLYTPYPSMKETQAILIGLLVFVKFLRTRETFSSRVAEPLQIDHNVMVNPIGWQWVNDTTIKSTVRFLVTKGECDYENLIARPGFGFPSQSDGFGYSNWNRLQGTNAWFAWNEGTGGTGWFWWTQSPSWHKLPDAQKRKMLELDMFITSQGVTPQFPVGYSITCPDFNFNRSTRVWVQFTYNPMARIGPPNEDLKSKIKELPPLMVKDPEIFVHKEGWELIDPTLATIKIPIFASQGEFDPSIVKGSNKNRENEWFSWKTIQDKNRDHITLLGRLNNQAQPPHLPKRYMVEVKDSQRDRYVRVTITILNNPFVNSIEGVKDKRCPSKTETCMKMTRTSCLLPLLLRQQWQGISDNH